MSAKEDCNHKWHFCFKEESPGVKTEKKYICEYCLAERDFKDYSLRSDGILFSKLDMIITSKSVKLTVIDESIARCEKRIAELEKLIYACPLTDILKLRQEFSKRLKVIQANKDYSNKEWLNWLEDSTKKEKELFKFAKTQNKKIPAWIDESVKLRMQLSDLSSEKFYAEMEEKQKIERLLSYRERTRG